MKKIVSLFLILFMLCGCSAFSGTDTDSHAQITVNLPQDSSVNGYRTESPDSAAQPTEAPGTVSAGNIKPAPSPETDSAQSNPEAVYIGNSNSHVFHKSDCESVETMSKKNKITFESREKAVSKGYTPCKRCQP